LRHSCGYYVLQEGGREDQLAGCWRWFGKTSEGEERRREKKKRHRVEKKDTLGSIVVERNAREERVSER
jgi:hypothetical protein